MLASCLFRLSILVRSVSISILSRLEIDSSLPGLPVPMRRSAVPGACLTAFTFSRILSCSFLTSLMSACFLLYSRLVAISLPTMLLYSVLTLSSFFVIDSRLFVLAAICSCMSSDTSPCSGIACSRA